MELKIDVSNTPGKFQHMADEIVLPLLKVLGALNALEAKFSDTDKWDEFNALCKRIIDPISAKPFNRRLSMENPPRYMYLNEPETRVFFIMKSANRASVEFYFDGAHQKERFVFKNTENGWLVDEHKYGFSGSESWYLTDF
jgi:hypothetical protein